MMMVQEPCRALAHDTRMIMVWHSFKRKNGLVALTGIVNIHHISILPTTDEILCRRLPFVPKKGPHHKHHLPDGQARHLDINFRQLRYEHTESIIDICYHASQRLVTSTSEPYLTDYEVRSETPQGRRYSLFRDVEIVEINFEERNGILVRLSFSCPPALRGRHLPLSGHFEKGMLAALIGIDEACTCLSTTILEVVLCQSTNAMQVRTGNELRGQSLPLLFPLKANPKQHLSYSVLPIARIVKLCGGCSTTCRVCFQSDLFSLNSRELCWQDFLSA